MIRQREAAAAASGANVAGGVPLAPPIIPHTISYQPSGSAQAGHPMNFAPPPLTAGAGQAVPRRGSTVGAQNLANGAYNRPQQQQQPAIPGRAVPRRGSTTGRAPPRVTSL